MIFKLQEYPFIQSAFLNLQASGSTGIESTRGIHLRWFFTGLLGKYHLPLGNKGVGADLINRGKDYVYIYKLPYEEVKAKSKITLNFTEPPHDFKENSQDRDSSHPSWEYHVEGILFQVTFLDVDIYQATKLEFNYLHGNDHLAFYKAYCFKSGKLAIELLNDEQCFAISYDSAKSYKEMKVETFSTSIQNEEKKEVLSNRIDIDSLEDKLSERIEKEGILGENMNKLRCQFQGNEIGKVPQSINFYLYSRAIHIFEEKDAYEKLSLTKYLEANWDTVKRDLKLSGWKRWKHDKQPNETDSDRQPNERNYEEKYNELLIEHLQKLLHPTNDFVQHLYQKLASDTGTNLTAQSFTSLTIAALDYHIARMLGLGITDDKLGPEDEASYIYLMVYQIKKHGKAKDLLKSIPDGQHLYLSLPTSIRYNRRPESIDLQPIEYGFPESARTTIDEEGYAVDELTRYLRFHCRKTNYRQSDSFFVPDTPFSAAHLSSSVFAGVLHRKLGKDQWINPELRYFKSVWRDENGHEELIEEVHPFVIPSSLSDPAFVHELKYPEDQEDHDTAYEYAFYPIDIFSRAGAESNLVASNITEFTIPNLLLAPNNIKVQLIQDETDGKTEIIAIGNEENLADGSIRESSLMFTTKEDIDRVRALEEDKTLVKVTFDYNHLHDINSTKLEPKKTNHFGKEIEFFFRENSPRIFPKLAADQDDKIGESALDVKFGFGSADSIIKLISHPLEGNWGNFVGGVFATHGYRFKIVRVFDDGSQIEVEGVEERTQTDDDDEISSYNIQIKYPKQACGGSDSRYYTIHENMDKASSWGAPNPLSFKARVDFTAEEVPGWERREVTWQHREEGRTDPITRTLRGFWGSASITDENNGIYHISFNDLDHPTHPQERSDGNSVAFDKGTLRIPRMGNGQWKELQVLQIESKAGEKLQLKVINNTSETDFPKEGNIETNYYPSYKCYLVAEQTEGRQFNGAYVFPQEGRIKTTILSVRAKGDNPNADSNAPFYSSLSSPRLIKAEKRIPAVTPEEIPFEPGAPIYATPPDRYSKSTYTFKLPLSSAPYQIVVYRADITPVLNALYNPVTARTIKGGLDANDSMFPQRLYDFVNLLGVGENNALPFKRYPESSRPEYHFPTPDNPNLEADKYQKAIWESFIPITEKPILYSDVVEKYSEVGKNEPVTRDNPVKLLPANGDEPKKLLITDFNLDGEKTTSYFYMVRTIGTGYDISKPNNIIGPVQLINNRPPKAPIIKNVSIQYDDNFQPQVNFSILKYEDRTNIKKIELRSTNSVVKAKNWRLMNIKETMVIDQDLWTVSDASFRDEDHAYADIPFGESLFYRLNVQKEINYKLIGEAPRSDLIPSKASKVVSISLVDNKIPDPPELNINDDSAFFCNKTCYHGTYILEQLNHKGIWKLIAQKVHLPTTPLIKFSILPEEDLNPDVFLKYRVKVINTNGLDSGWSQVFIFSIDENGSIRKIN